MQSNAEYRLSRPAKSGEILSVLLVLCIAIAWLAAVLVGFFPPLLLLPLVAIPFQFLRFLWGDRVKLTAKEIRLTSGKTGASVLYSDVERVRIADRTVEVELKGDTSWWRRFNFRGGSGFTLGEDASPFVSQLEMRLGDFERRSSQDGSTVLQRPAGTSTDSARGS